MNRTLRTAPTRPGGFAWNAGETPAFHISSVDGNIYKVALRASGHGTPCPYIKNEKINAGDRGGVASALI
ncbi:MAG: hypothetical protein LBP68_08395 [Acidobacteriota bacterium]|jgi:hypothetical protein|nr:hypothetical protein [Acidobacteriota bacterium]